MTDALVLAGAVLAGGLLGAVFFGGLWWTTRALDSTRRPALLVSVSFLLRTAAALAGFYLVGAGSWQRLSAAVLGFIIARLLIVRRVKRDMRPV